MASSQGWMPFTESKWNCKEKSKYIWLKINDLCSTTYPDGFESYI